MKRPFLVIVVSVVFLCISCEDVFLFSYIESFPTFVKISDRHFVANNTDHSLILGIAFSNQLVLENINRDYLYHMRIDSSYIPQEATSGQLPYSSTHLYSYAFMFSLPTNLNSTELCKASGWRDTITKELVAPMALLNKDYKEYKLYDLTDTTSLDLYAPGAVRGIVKTCSLKEEEDYYPLSTMTYYLTVTNEMLEGMRKDYSMLETFREYYDTTPTD